MRAALLGALLVASAANAVPVTFNNSQPRLATNGTIVDGHDARTQKFPSIGDGLYYMAAIAYGQCQEPARYGCDQTDVQ